MKKGERWTAVVGQLVKRLLYAVGELGPRADSETEGKRRTEGEPEPSERALQSEASGPADSGHEHPAAASSGGGRKQGTRRRPQRNMVDLSRKPKRSTWS